MEIIERFLHILGILKMFKEEGRALSIRDVATMTRTGDDFREADSILEYLYLAGIIRSTSTTYVSMTHSYFELAPEKLSEMISTIEKAIAPLKS